MRSLLFILLIVAITDANCQSHSFETVSFLNNDLFEFRYDKSKYFLYDDETLKYFNKLFNKKIETAFMGGMGLENSDTGVPIILFQLLRNFDGRSTDFVHLCSKFKSSVLELKEEGKINNKYTFFCDTRNSIIVVNNKISATEYHRSYVVPSKKGLIILHIYDSKPIENIESTCNQLLKSIIIRSEYVGLPEYSSWKNVNWKKSFIASLHALVPSPKIKAKQ